MNDIYGLKLTDYNNLQSILLQWFKKILNISKLLQQKCLINNYNNINMDIDAMDNFLDICQILLYVINNTQFLNNNIEHFINTNILKILFEWELFLRDYNKKYLLTKSQTVWLEIMKVIYYSNEILFKWINVNNNDNNNINEPLSLSNYKKLTNLCNNSMLNVLNRLQNEITILVTNKKKQPNKNNNNNNNNSDSFKKEFKVYLNGQDLGIALKI